MQTCPKCGYVRKLSDAAPKWECPKCGIAYEKYGTTPHGHAHNLPPIHAGPESETGGSCDAGDRLPLTTEVNNLWIFHVLAVGMFFLGAAIAYITWRDNTPGGLHGAWLLLWPVVMGGLAELIGQLDRAARTGKRSSLLWRVALGVVFSFPFWLPPLLRFASGISLPRDRFRSIRLEVVNGALTDKELGDLHRRLASTLLAPISESKINVSLDTAYGRYRSQYNAGMIIDMKAIFPHHKAGEYIVAFTPVDIYDLGYGFLFADTRYLPFKRTVFGLVRLKADPGSEDVPKALVDRIYKLLLRRVGMIVGLDSSCGPMNFPNSLAVLDSASAQYCMSDAFILRHDGYIR